MNCSVIRVALLLVAGWPALVHAEYPVERPKRNTPAAAEGQYAVHTDRPQQVIKGLGFEIQSDSIASGNRGLPEATTSVPHDLVPAERQRFCQEMLRGFRYCRLAGGLYWRGLDPEQKYLRSRWPEQLPELRQMLQAAGIEGVSLEYWSHAPYWKANRKYTGADKSENVLRCFGKKFADDPDYHGDVDRFLKDFAEACRRDLATLRAAGIPISMWGLKNEPPTDCPYSSCRFTPENYARTFRAAAPAVRAFDPKIRIIADTAFGWDFKYIRPVLAEPGGSRLVDFLVIHHVGSDAKAVLAIPPHAEKPRFQNEFEYLGGPTSPARCLNTTLHIMNWFQVGQAPTWFWIHALKPLGNQEASGYSLGFWRPLDDRGAKRGAGTASLAPGHWTWNKYNWHAVGSFLRHMPWDCRAVAVTEAQHDPDLRILAFTRPDGKLTIVLANRSFRDHVFHVETGRKNVIFRGFRYTPDAAGDNCQGVAVEPLRGGTISPKVADMTWEFWEEE